MKRLALFGVAAQMSGVEFTTLYLARCLDRAQWVPVVACPGGEFSERCREEGIQVVLRPAPHFFSTSVQIGKWTIPNPLAITADAARLLLAARGLAKFFRAEQFDLIVTKGLLAHFLGGLAARWARMPCVWHVQDRVSDRAGPLYARTLALAGKILACEIIVDAESIARQLAPTIPRERVQVIWNGVDTREFAPHVDGSGVRAEWKKSPGDSVIGNAGRLTRWKGQDLLIRAFARLAPKFPNAYLAIVGAALFESDAYTAELRALVNDLGLTDRVIFAGFRWDMPRVYAAFDILAHTSLDKDSSPLAVVSAMAAGKAIVCAQIDGTAQLFDESVDGLLFPPGNADALAEKLEMVLADRDLRMRLGRAARAKAERELSVENFTRRCEAVFERAVRKV